MKLDNYKIMKENIEYMLWIGMKVGEIQAVYPQVKGGKIHEMGKELGINTRVNKDNSGILNRNNETIKKFLRKFIEENRDSRDVSKVILLEKMLDTLKPSSNGRYPSPKRQKEVDEEER